MEIWKDIKGFEGYYQVSDNGRVKGLDRTIKMKSRTGTPFLYPMKGKVLSESRHRDGYAKVCLYRVAVKTFQVHRLVAQAFIPNPDNKPEVNHINGIKDDNRRENLEWSTKLENHLHAVNVLRVGCLVNPRGEASSSSKLTESDVLEIRGRKGLRYGDKRMLAKRYDVSESLIGKVLKRVIWKHI